MDETPPGPEVPEKIKKRYRKKKTKLEEAFPAYLQVCHLLIAYVFDMPSKLITVYKNENERGCRSITLC